MGKQKEVKIISSGKEGAAHAPGHHGAIRPLNVRKDAATDTTGCFLGGGVAGVTCSG